MPPHVARRQAETEVDHGKPHSLDLRGRVVDYMEADQSCRAVVRQFAVVRARRCGW
jgi:hypothetical protein